MPMQIEKTTLSGKGVRLEPLAEQHLPGLAEAVRDGELWLLPVTMVPRPEALPKFLADAEAQFHAGRELTFATNLDIHEDRSLPLRLAVTRAALQAKGVLP